MALHFSLLFFYTFIIFLTLGAPSKKTSAVLSDAATHDEQVKQQLINVSQQLDRVELQLNNSINQLLEKIDENTHDIIHLIKSIDASQTNSEFSFSNL
jgi:hypothetical protein